MRKHMKLLAAVAGVSLLALTIAGNLSARGPKPETAMYTIQGHVCSGDGYDIADKWNCVVDLENDTHAVEIGVNAPGWVPENGTLELRVSGDVLCAATRQGGVWLEPCVPILDLPGPPYYGRARLLDHRFDFEFDTNSNGCKLITYSTPFPLEEGDGYCRYGLIFVVQDWKPDGSVGFSEFRFLDYTQGNSLTDPQIYRGGGLVPEWSDDVSTNLKIQLLFPAADEPGGGGPCTDLKPEGASCYEDSECCSGNCKGKPGAKTCK